MFKQTENGVMKVTTTETEQLVSSDVIKKRIERKEEQLKVLKVELSEVQKLEKENNGNKK